MDSFGLTGAGFSGPAPPSSFPESAETRHDETPHHAFPQKVNTCDVFVSRYCLLKM